MPLPTHYYEEYRKHGFAYSPAEFETLSCETYSCSRCKCSDRDRLYALYLAELLDCRPPAHGPLRLLDIAPATALARRLKADPRVVHRSADLHMPGADDHVSLTDLHCYSDGQFDFAICSHVLEHIHDDVSAVRELCRVLSPTGSAIVMVPIPAILEHTQYDPNVSDDAERWRRYGQNDHVRLYSRAGLLSLLAGNGFRVEALGCEHFGEAALDRAGISPRSVLYVAHRVTAAP